MCNSDAPRRIPRKIYRGRRPVGRPRGKHCAALNNMRSQARGRANAYHVGRLWLPEAPSPRGQNPMCTETPTPCEDHDPRTNAEAYSHRASRDRACKADNMSIRSPRPTMDSSYPHPTPMSPRCTKERRRASTLRDTPCSPWAMSLTYSGVFPLASTPPVAAPATKVVF